ncbi:MAG: AAA family ATPase [Deltaproteobacteria bacterium]|nr:MAG: AAA family ATPase [Deltaproteobacteria bacterium]
MEALFAKLRRVARAQCTVLVGGETGTGKELVARAIHAESPRRRAPFQAVNCATFSPTLLESELFGHVRGAFTGAVRDRQGLFALAHQGTLFLDEVAEIPLDLQGKLLRVMQEKTFVPVGATRPVTVDVRVISATNKPLRQEVDEGRFREDLSYRLRVVPLLLPPLRRREGDVEALFWHFVSQLNQQGMRRIEGVTRTAMDAILAYTWPGNVRELRSAVEYAFVVGEGPVLDVADLTPELRGEPPPGISSGSLADIERGRILAALARHHGRKAAAAAELGISRTTLWRKLYAHRLR